MLISKFLRTPILQNTSGQLLLKTVIDLKNFASWFTVYEPIRSAIFLHANDKSLEENSYYFIIVFNWAVSWYDLARNTSSTSMSIFSENHPTFLHTRLLLSYLEINFFLDSVMGNFYINLQFQLMILNWNASILKKNHWY